jgi:hypothetical protein
MKWWWGGLTLARGAHCTDCWLKENGLPFWFLLTADETGVVNKQYIVSWNSILERHIMICFLKIRHHIHKSLPLDIIVFNPLTAGHETIRAGFRCPQCYARVNTVRLSRAPQ